MCYDKYIATIIPGASCKSIYRRMSDSTSSETISKDATNTVIEQSTSSLDKACQTECQILYNMKRFVKLLF